MASRKKYPLGLFGKFQKLTEGGILMIFSMDFKGFLL
jgi:hypothetical protein